MIERVKMSVAPEQKGVQGGVKMMKSSAVVTISMFLFLMLSGYAFAGDYKLPDTGIHKCYDAEKEIPCPSLGQPFYGQDAQYDGPQPAYRDNGNGTATDLNTGLMWQQSDDGTTRTWPEAIDYCTALTFPSGEYSDWRLPDRRELMSIVDFGRANPAINMTYFPGCRSFHYWSSSPYVNLSFAWYVDFDECGVNWNNKFRLYYVRCVRAEP